MQIDRLRLIEDLKAARKIFVHNPSKDIINNNLDGFVALNNILGSISDKMFNLEKIFFDNKRVDQITLNRELKDLDMFIDYLNNNEDEIKTIFKNYDEFLKSIHFQFYPFGKKIKYYNEKQFKDIILSYYSLYGNNIYKIVKKYFDENRIEMGFDIADCENYAAAFASIHMLKTGYIVSGSKTFNTYSMSDLVHELGHAINAETFMFPQQKKYNILPDVLGEVPSTTYEVNFLKYLSDNNIDPIGARLIEADKLSSIEGLSDMFEEVYSLDTADADLEGNIYNENNEPIEARNGLIYGLGYYFALHLSHIYKQDINEFNKIFFNLVSTRKERQYIGDSIDLLGISREEFLSGDLIKHDITENQGILKLKFPNYRSYYE